MNKRSILAWVGVLIGSVSAQGADDFFKIEAENYVSSAGIRLETCTDDGAGQNVAYISDSDWCMYEDITLGTNAQLNFRVARPGYDDGHIEVRLDATNGTLVAQVDVPVTGGWQDWQTLSTSVGAVDGIHDIYLVFVETSTANDSSMFNLNWWSREAGPVRIEAEDYTAMNDVRLATCLDIGGGQDVEYIDDDDWTEHTIHVETPGLYKVEFRVASSGGAGTINLLIGNETIGSVSVGDTGGWQAWETVSTYMNFTQTGVQTVRLDYDVPSRGFNVNWFSYLSVSTDGAIALTVGDTRNQMMRYGMDYERLWYWSGNLENVPDWTVNDCNIDYIRTAVSGGYELTENEYQLDAYLGDASGQSKDKIIPMMTAMQNANPNIKWFASPQPLDESLSGASWQPYPLWITGATTSTSGNYDFEPIKCAQYLIRYLRLMKHYGFKISYLDLTNEWQSNDYGSRITQSNARDLVEYMKAYIANPPDPASDPTDPTGFYAANYPALEPGDMPLTVAASSWEFSQGESWISNLDDERRRAAIDIASSHNTNRDDGSGTEQSFADQVHTTLGADTEIWQTEVHGWKNKHGANEATSFEHMMMAIRAGFTGINGWLALGGLDQGHTYLWKDGDTITRGMKYFIFQKLSNTSNYGYYLEVNEPAEFNNTMALIRDNLLTVWVNNMSSSAALAEIDFSGHVWSGEDITYTRWNEGLTIEGVEGIPASSTSTSLMVVVEGESLYCIEIPLVNNEDNFPFVQAESYDSGSGVSIQSCSDTDGGDMVAFSDVGDEICFDLDVTKTYGFDVGFRISSASATIQFDIYDGTTLLGSVEHVSTGDAQSWTTVHTTLDLDGGPMNLKIVATGGGWNMNWIEFEPAVYAAAPTDLYSTIANLSVTLDWVASANAMGYDVKRSAAGGSGYVSIGQTTDLTYTDTTVAAGQTYYYRVAATNAYGANDSAVVTGYGLPYDLIGPASTYADESLEKDNLFDKDVNTFYDTTANNSWAGLDFGPNNEQRIMQIDYVLRNWSASIARTTNATFQGANSADFSDAVTLYTVPSSVAGYPTVNTATITDTTSYRYIRMLAQPGRPLYGVAELDITSIAVATPNGTPISWLISHGLTSEDDDLDNDGDGLETWEEYLAGTIPTNAASVLKITSVNSTGENAQVSWQSVSGKTYSIYTNWNLVTGSFNMAISGVPGEAGETSITLDSASDTLFFEVEVE